jgi:hypothetical protein
VLSRLIHFDDARAAQGMADALQPATRDSANNADINTTITPVATARRLANRRRIVGSPQAKL